MQHSYVPLARAIQVPDQSSAPLRVKLPSWWVLQSISLKRGILSLIEPLTHSPDHCYKKSLSLSNVSKPGGDCELRWGVWGGTQSRGLRKVEILPMALEYFICVLFLGKCFMDHDISFYDLGSNSSPHGYAPSWLSMAGSTLCRLCSAQSLLHLVAKHQNIGYVKIESVLHLC